MRFEMAFEGQIKAHFCALFFDEAVLQQPHRLFFRAVPAPSSVRPQRTALFRERTNSATGAAAARFSRSTIFTTALPTMTPSQ